MVRASFLAGGWVGVDLSSPRITTIHSFVQGVIIENVSSIDTNMGYRGRL